MNCQKCGAMFPDGTPRCPKCGMPAQQPQAGGGGGGGAKKNRPPSSNFSSPETRDSFYSYYSTKDRNW